MYLQYRGYLHGFCECGVKIDIGRIYGVNRVPIALSQRWVITGRLVGDSVADMTTKIAALEAAYSVNHGDLYLLNADMSQSAHKIISAQTLTGTMVESLSYPNENDIYSTHRNYVIVITTETDAASQAGGGGGSPSGPGQIVSFRESISFRGTGGPRVAVREQRRGPPVRQQVSQSTPIYATQRGQSIGLYGYPAASQPMWPQYEQEADRQIDYDEPEVSAGAGSGQQNRQFATRWSYSFIASQRINGKPGMGY